MRDEEVLKALTDAKRFNDAEQFAKRVGLEYVRPTEENLPEGEAGPDSDESGEEEGSEEKEGSGEEVSEEEGAS